MARTNYAATLRDKCIELLREHPDWSVNKIKKIVGCNSSTVKAARAVIGLSDRGKAFASKDVRSDEAEAEMNRRIAEWHAAKAEERERHNQRVLAGL